MTRTAVLVLIAAGTAVMGFWAILYAIFMSEED